MVAPAKRPVEVRQVIEPELVAPIEHVVPAFIEGEADLQSVAVMLDQVDEIERLRSQLKRIGIAAP